MSFNIKQEFYVFKKESKMNIFMQFVFEMTASYCAYLFWMETGLSLKSLMYSLFFFTLIAMSYSLQSMKREREMQG